MLYINDINTDPYWNLAAEEYLLKHFSQPVFRLWRNSNAIIVGHYQNTLAEIDYNYVKENNIKVVRRLSGGGAVFHDLGNLNFTFIEQKSEMEESSAMFRRFTAPILAALDSLGVKASIEGRNDLLIDGKKFSGNAICIYKDRILQHGTLLFSSNMSNLSQALKSRPEKFIGKAVQSTRSRVTNISSHLPRPMTIDQFQEYLGSYICNIYNKTERSSENGTEIIHYNYTPEDLAAIEELRDTKYLPDSWNFGHSPAYQLNNTRRFPGGLIEFSITARNGIIREMEIYGDYFFTRPTEEFIEAVTGTPHTEQAVSSLLAQLPVNEYFNGVTPEELIQLFF
ncbi:MAG: lipoate--protein ligase [Bacteroidales bacterium]|nr:lipoate--protein ligase [Bacteroidales bacterium]